MSIRASKRIKQEVSLSLPIGTDKDGNEISFNDILGTDTDEIIDDISLKIQVVKLYRAIAKVLTPRERTVIIKRYGLDGGEALPQREIAAALGISRSYVSRIEKKALEAAQWTGGRGRLKRGVHRAGRADRQSAAVPRLTAAIPSDTLPARETPAGLRTSRSVRSHPAP